MDDRRPEPVEDPGSGEEPRWDAPALEELYDPDVLARIEGVPAPGPAGGQDEAVEEAGPSVGGSLPRRWGTGGAMLAAAMFGLGDVLEPDKARQHVIEFVPDALPADDQPVTYLHVPGAPRASRIVVRPWLLDRLRRSG
jgi:hypothetical protein